MSGPNYGVIIIGAGPAGMFCARELPADTGILMIDAGRRLKRKACPLTSTGKCMSCKPVCCVLGGMGGSQFFLGTKLSRYPAGKGLSRFAASTSELEATYDHVDRILELHGKLPREYPDPERIAALNRRCQRLGLEPKYYNAQKVSALEMNRIAESFFNELEARSIECHSQERVLEIVRSRGHYQVRTDKGTYRGKKLVFATGRLGAAEFSRLANALGLEWYDSGESEVEIGVRVETRFEVFDTVDGLHNDLKLKLALGPREDVRSFCQDYRGYLTRCCYNFDPAAGFSSIDGYIMGTDRCAGNRSEVANLGIHHRFPLKGGIVAAQDLVRRISSHGQPLVQSMGAFLRNEATSCFSLPPSMPDAVQADINRFLPKATGTAIKKFIHTIERLLPGFAHEGNAVYAPSFEMGGRQVRLSPSFESSLPGVYVLGDATGHFRGAQQAMVSGVLAARAIRKEAVMAQELI